MQLAFTKMHGAGNDFVVLDATRAPLALNTAQLRLLADRHFGVGADQILVVEAAPSPEVDFGYRIFNADGGEVEQCGNGARCFVAYVHGKGLTAKRRIRVQTLSGLIEPELQPDGRVTVDMGAPVFDLPRVPFEATGLTPQPADDWEQWPLDIADATAWVSVLSMGNPHAVQRVDDVDTAPVLRDGPLIENHPRFPNRVNAGFMQIVDAQHIRLRVWERGAGETLACGTGACAALVAAVLCGHADRKVQMKLAGGNLMLNWNAEDNHVYQTGPAAFVFDGEWLG